MFKKEADLMRKRFFIIAFVQLIVQFNTVPAQVAPKNHPQCYEWAIVGAGFAGITALAVLLDAGVKPSSVVWVDPEFNVGRVGKHYREVPGNIQTKHLIEYVEDCPGFENIDSPSLQKLYTYPAEQFQKLEVIVDPLLDFTAHLQKMVVPIQDSISSLTRVDNHWILESRNRMVYAKKVILAIGAHPKRLDYDIPDIPLDDAFDKEKLSNAVSPEDSIAVFGGMHSAMLVLRNLCECFVKQIVNFYVEDYFHGSPGLEGVASMWAEEVLEKNPPANLVRVLNTPENISTILPACTKAVYAIGYESNKILINDSSDVMFDEYTGMIDEDLYGIGIAFPPTGIFNGQKIAKNGLYAYLVYAKKLMPRWISNDKGFLIEDDGIEIPWI